MTADFLQYFYTEKFEDKIILKTPQKSFTVKEIKNLVRYKIDFLENIKEKNIILTAENNLTFIINFFACTFLNKEIFLFNNIKKSAEIEEKYFLLGEETGLTGDYDFKKINAKDVIINIFTSGSSGKSKRFKKSLENLILESKDLKEELGLKNNTEIFSTTTINQSYGITFFFVLPLYCDFIINTDIIKFPQDFSEKDAVLITSPSFLEKMYKYDEKPQLKFRYIFSAGAKLEKEIFDFANSISKKVIDIYGSTETGTIGYRHFAKDKFKLIKNVKILSLNDEGTIMFSKYALCETAKIGDRIEVDENNELNLKGRCDNILKIQEKRISAFEIENELNNNELIKEVKCIKSGEKLACIAALNEKGKQIFLEKGNIELIKLLKEYLNDKFEIIPQRWKFIDELPKTQNGKIARAKIENIFNLNLSLPFVINHTYMENSAEIKLVFYKNCNFFKGHFDKFPIVPGVVQLFYAAYFINDAFNINCVSGQIKKIKFSKLIKPDIVVNLKLERIKGGINYKYFVEDKIFSSGMLPCENILKG